MSSGGRRVNKQVAHFTLFRKRGTKTSVRCDRCCAQALPWSADGIAHLGANEDWDCGYMLGFLRAHAHDIKPTPLEVFRELFGYDKRRCRRAARIWRELLQRQMLKSAGVTDG